MRRVHEAVPAGAPEVVIWGSGTPRREFLHKRDDMAAAAVHLMNVSAAAYAAETRPMCSHINVGTGVDVTIRELAESLAQVVGYPGRSVFDSTKLDGTPASCWTSRGPSAWAGARIGLAEGLASTYREAFLDGASLRLG